ncbi:hypothetical protein Kpol_1052p9 [Vanderwaltozyma polyspora DSM 70294]|uniref:Vacuolar membrane protease n=1 Tax=Vanderwaltozyma polyspora (strain ATCC 22028 / DSM 70294 / BCRC 21397 / CBS 2163 / NBRC 10782 / NRRL Y-8283 / UCD 57-17) TaxID=436907 RepID=PFF1_VANPO|nr:uncharacterized protein Kpol_1052p9 [Vanderwaltozyma polyspora DSM 70294]A7TM20.1 RecName: Full=Vacuolar membrane protease; AltName: Full=FXNA-related family protease 1 [Vanderwaltozyma polyspora DSM 70294]EDO16662.1 hypothetical protein Kpol_1052p9 [Vanderwaltozyma polyspora DSM 70294]
MGFNSIFKFRKTSLSLLLFAVYFIIGILYFIDKTRYKHSLPIDSEGVALLDNAWLDLQNITNKCHPYSSKENDRVHDYLLNRIADIINKTSYAEVSDDYSTNSRALFKQQDVFNASSIASRIIYFESSNILVKMEGRNPVLKSLLLSAHYDSTPSSHGVTDDGKGIVSLLALLEHFSKVQPERTLVFNFNNNEEFGLLGATIFFEHEWSKNVEYFINLEGTGIGGKAVLFRTTDTSTAKIYQNSVKNSPFGNSIYQQGFYNRYIGSETDYKVYENKGLRGWDIAFYKPRNLYHTIEDSIGHSSKPALWHMLHTSLQLSKYIAELDNISLGETQDLSPAVYFDLAGYTFVAIPSTKLFWINIALLIIMPIISIFLFSIVKKYNNEIIDSGNIWWRLPISAMSSGTIIIFTTKLIMKWNPYILSRNFLLPLIGLTFEFIILNSYILTMFENLSSSFDFKTIAINEISFLFWIVLAYQTWKLYDNNYQNTGIYPFTICYIVMATAGNIGYLFLIFKNIEIVEDEEASLVQYVSNEQSTIEGRYRDEINGRDDSSRDSNSASIPTRANDERAPLLTNSVDNINQRTILKESKLVYNYDWIIEFLLVVPFSTFLLYNSLELIMDAVNQTIQETGDLYKVYKILAIGSILISIPTLPFAYKIGCQLGKTLTFISIGCLLISMALAPFTEMNPIKFRFMQVNDKVEISGVTTHDNNKLRDMINNLPSVKRDDKKVQCQEITKFSSVCEYEGSPVHLVDNMYRDKLKLMEVIVLKDDRLSPERSPYAPITAEVEIRVQENRMCNVYFGQNKERIREVNVSIIEGNDRNSSVSLRYRVNNNRNGIDELQLHKLRFEANSYIVGIKWMPEILMSNEEEDDVLPIKVECYWGEYEESSVEVGEGEVGGGAVIEYYDKIPSYSEILEYKPVDVVIANREKGLVKLTEAMVL